ncbi:MAG TPA: universal stress protein, partial [Longimicrobiales bacterium]|nr:universal stress protein [Longimicrobiales bacterium]
SCIVVNAELELPLHLMLVATGIDSLHSGALEEAFHWAKLLGDPEHGTELVVLTVVPDAGKLDEVRIRQQLDEKIGAAFAGASAPAWITTARRVACNSSIPRAITDAATREQAQLIVIGKHSRSHFTRSLIGSVATAVTQYATQPVLLVPPALCLE